ncbi:MAG: ATP-dependent sacrificial sulfur transferase LarE [Magnetococcales bacterium]|nr:ATP-dependent sacrificial sulfur transferase LarE [Magnetococcales bacterium]
MTISLSSSSSRLAVAAYPRLFEILSGFDHLLVAFSGGVDSTCLLASAVVVLGADRVVALTATSPSLSRHELQEAQSLAEAMGVEHRLRESAEMEKPEYAANDMDRCYHCKHALFDLCAYELIMRLKAPERWQVAYGANQDDLEEFRPGMVAAEERGIRAPLLEAGLGKGMVRELSRGLGLPTAEKAAFACLSSRFPRLVPITAEGLARVEAAEAVLRGEGFYQYRVRYHGELARVEVGVEELARWQEEGLQEKVRVGILAAGFGQVEFDPNGYRAGGAG